MLPKRVRMFALFALCFISWTSRADVTVIGG